MMRLFYCFCDISKRNLFVLLSDVAGVECVDMNSSIAFKLTMQWSHSYLIPFA